MPDAFKPKFDSLVAIFEHAVAAHRDRPLFGTKVGSEWRWMTYGEFGRQTGEVRAGLAALGVGEGDAVAMITNNRPEWAIAAYATYGRAAAFVPMYESQLPSDWEHILGDCGAKVVFVANEDIQKTILELEKGLPKLEHVVLLDGKAADEGALTFAELRAKGRGKDVPNATPTGDDLAGLIYTSGTTGKPKGVRLSHRNLASNVSAMHEVFPMTPDDRSLSFLPWAHSFGQTVELHGLFSMGASMGIAEAVDKIVANLSEVRPTLLFSVPRIFNRIYDGVHKQVAESSAFRKSVFNAALANSVERKRLAEKRRTSGVAEFKQRIFDRLVFQKIRDRFGGRLRYAFSGGAAINKDVAEFIDNLGITVYEGYGLTETSPIATANWPGARKIGSVGKAIPGVRVAIDLSATGDPRNGEIVVYGHNVMQGYHGLPEEDAKVFTEDGGFRTGDMGFLDDEGFLTITGRIKEQYKLENGKYVAPAPLEEKIKLSPMISNCYLFGDNKPHNVLLVVPERAELERWAAEQNIAESWAQLVAHPKVVELYEGEVQKFTGDWKGYERPRKVVVLAEDFTVDNGMLTPKLSLKRRVVLEKYGALLDSLY